MYSLLFSGSLRYSEISRPNLCLLFTLAVSSLLADMLDIDNNRALWAIGGAFHRLLYASRELIMHGDGELRALNAHVFPVLVDIGQYRTGVGLRIASKAHLVCMNEAFAALVSVYKLNIGGNTQQRSHATWQPRNSAATQQRSYAMYQRNGMLPALQCFWAPGQHVHVHHDNNNCTPTGGRGPTGSAGT